MSGKTGYSLRQIRNVLGLSHEEMGEYLNVSDTTIEKYETGHRNIPYNKLRKLVTNQKIWTLDELDKGDIPDIDLSTIDFSPLFDLLIILFPIIKPSESVTSSNFIDVYNKHKSFLDYSFLHEIDIDNEDDYNFSWLVKEIRQIKQNYALLANKNSALRPFCAANIVSLTLFYASFVNQYFHEEYSLVSFAFMKKMEAHIDSDDSEDSDDSFLKGFDLQAAYKELHRKEVYDKLQHYLGILSEHTEYNELTDYYSAFLYYNDLVSTKYGWDKSREIFWKKQRSLYKAGNHYMKQFVNVFLSMYHIDL